MIHSTSGKKVTNFKTLIENSIKINSKLKEQLDNVTKWCKVTQEELARNKVRGHVTTDTEYFKDLNDLVHKLKVKCCLFTYVK